MSDIEGLAEFAEHVRHEFDGFMGERSQHGLDHWQQSFELHATSISPAVQLSDDKQQHITLLARGAVLAEGPYAEVAANPLVIEAYMGSANTELKGAH